MRLIDVDELLKKLQEVKDEDPINLLVAREKVLEIILNAPPLIKCGITSEGLPLLDLTPRPQDKWGKWVISEIQCPICLEFFQTDCYSMEELKKCPSCGAVLRRWTNDS